MTGKRGKETRAGETSTKMDWALALPPKHVKKRSSGRSSRGARVFPFSPVSTVRMLHRGVSQLPLVPDDICSGSGLADGTVDFDLGMKSAVLSKIQKGELVKVRATSSIYGQ